MTELPPQRTEYLSEFSNAMWSWESDPLLRTTGTVMFLLDRLPDRSLVMERMDRLSRIVPGFRHRLVRPPFGLATPRWVIDPDFDLSYHVQWVDAPEPKTLDTVLEYARKSAMSGLDMGRPPWIITIVGGLEDGRAVMIYKMHHATMDGGGLSQMFTILFDNEREPAIQPPMPPLPPGAPMSTPELTVDALQRMGSQCAGLVKNLGGAALRSAPNAVLNPVPTARAAARNVAAVLHIVRPRLQRHSPIMVERHGWWRFAKFNIDYPQFRKAAKNVGATINDAVLAAVGTGFALYHEKHDAPIEKIRVVLAINVRRPEDPPFGNQVNGGFLELPVSTTVTPALMAEYHALVDEHRVDANQPLADAVGALLGRTGPVLAGAMMKHAEVVVSHIPGPDIEFFCGAEVLEIFGFGPPFGAATNVSMMGYHGNFCVNLNADAAAVPDSDLLLECLKEGFAQVLALG